MIRRVGVVVAWLAATMVSMLIAATAVGSVRGQVTDVPAIPSAGTALLATTTTVVTESSTTGAPPTTDVPTPTTTVATPSTITTTTTSTTSTTVPTSTTTTTAPNGPVVTTYRLDGGEIRISALEPHVNLVSAFPFGGFSVEVDEAGPEEVGVEFESSDHESSFRARWKDGELDIDIDEES